ncbi:CsgG/HfaB family protein, partial [Vibrio cholerae]
VILKCYKMELIMKKTASVIIILAILLVAGCGSVAKKGYTNPNYSISSVKRIAILPFDGVTDANTAADMISMVLSNRNVFDAVVDRAQISDLIAEHQLPRDLLNDETVIAKKRLINADALLKGRVTRFEQGEPSFPLATPTKISMSLKLISSETGQTIWTQLYSKSSAGRGLLAPSVDEMMIDMAEEIANDLANLK